MCKMQDTAVLRDGGHRDDYTRPTGDDFVSLKGATLSFHSTCKQQKKWLKAAVWLDAPTG